MDKFFETFGYPSFNNIPKADMYDLLGEYASAVSTNACAMARLERGVLPSLSDDKEMLKNGLLYGVSVILMCACAIDKSIFDNIDDCAAQLLTDYYISAMTDKAKREGRGDLFNPFLVNIIRERLLKETKDALKNTKDKKENPYKLNVKPMTEEDASNLVKDLLDRFNKGAPPFPFPNDKTE